MLPQAPFGRTGHESTRVIFGAAALGRMRQERADQVLEILLRHGVNHIDTAAMYGDSELRIGPWMAEHRSMFFLATKTGERRGDDARAQLEQSLTRMQVDSVDMIQLHNLVEPDEWDVAHGPGGALEALVRAREEGLTRFIGVTGHGTRIAGMHLRSLERFDFDAVLLPYSYIAMQDPAYRADVEALLEQCAERRTAVQTIKGIARRRWAPDHDGPRHSWYEPLRDDEAIGRAVRWVLGNPQVFLNTSSDASLLETVLDAAAAGGARPTDAEMAADVDTQGVQPLFDGRELERI
jgi:aryl-alcohol dehydrogenase-like predicted oxidoreductase